MSSNVVVEPSAVSAGNRTSFFNQLWAIRLPQWLGSRFPSAAEAVADGAWLAGSPRVAAFAPLVAFAIGILAPLPLPGMGTAYVFSESLWFMALVIAGAIMSGTVGVMLLVGYICGDLLWETVRIGLVSVPSESVRFAVVFRASRVLAYLLLAVLAYRIPLLARSLASSLLATMTSNGVVSEWWRAGIYSLTCGMLVFLWCQGMIVLVRPVFTWVRLNPSVAAVAPVQLRWRWLVGAAVIAAVVRVVTEHVKAPQLADSELARDIRARRQTAQRRHALDSRRRKSWGWIAVTAATTTMLAAGSYGGWIDAGATLVATSLFAIWQTGRIGRLPLGWVRLMQRIPALLRFMVVPAVGYVIGRQVLERMWSTDSFRPLLISLLLTLLLYCLFFPKSQFGPSIDKGVTA